MNARNATESLNSLSPTSSSPVELWSFAKHREAEHLLGQFASRDEAATAARAHFPDAKDVWLFRFEHPDPAKFMPDADWIGEWMAREATELYEEAPEDWPELSDEARAELNDLLSVWARKHIKTTFLVACTALERA